MKVTILAIGIYMRMLEPKKEEKNIRFLYKSIFGEVPASDGMGII